MTKLDHFSGEMTRMNSCINIHSAWSFRQISITVTTTSSISYANWASCWSFSHASSSITASCATCSSWTSGTIADCERVATSATKRNQPSPHLTCVSHLIFSNVRPSSRFPLFRAQFSLCTWGLGAASCGKTSVDELLGTIAHFSPLRQDRLTNSRYRVYWFTLVSLSDRRS